MKKTGIFMAVAAASLMTTSGQAEETFNLSCEAQTQFCLMKKTGSTRCDPQKSTRHALEVSGNHIKNLDEYGFLTFDGSCETHETKIECHEHKPSTLGSISRSFVLSRLTGEGTLITENQYKEESSDGATGHSLRGTVLCKKASDRPLF